MGDDELSALEAEAFIDQMKLMQVAMLLLAELQPQLLRHCLGLRLRHDPDGTWLVIQSMSNVLLTAHEELRGLQPWADLHLAMTREGGER